MTKAYYETKNTHEARNEAIETGNKYFAELIWNAWKKLDEVDYRVSWDEFDFSHNLTFLREVDTELANELEAEAVRVYGDTEATIVEDASMYW